MTKIPMELLFNRTSDVALEPDSIGAQLMVPVHPDTTAYGLKLALIDHPIWRNGLNQSREEIAEAINLCVTDFHGVENDPHAKPFADLQPTVAPDDMFVSYYNLAGDRWAVINKNTGDIIDIMEDKEGALREAWRHSDQRYTAYAYYCVSLRMPEGYGLTHPQQNIIRGGGFRFEIDGERSDSYSTEFEAHIGAWQHHFQRQPVPEFSAGIITGPEQDRPNWTAGIDHAQGPRKGDKVWRSRIEVHSDLEESAIIMRDHVLSSLHAHDTLVGIHRLLDGHDWNVEKLSMIGELLLEAGFTFRKAASMPGPVQQ